MIEITVHDVPAGDERQTSVIARATISRTIDGYQCRFWERDKPGMGVTTEAEIQFEGYSHGVWELLKQALIRATDRDGELQFERTRPEG